jgi:hypothetical protein
MTIIRGKWWAIDRDAKRVATVMLLSLTLGMLAVACAIDGPGDPSQARWSALLWCLACCAAGSFIGFIFGIPRTLSSDTARHALPPEQTARGAPTPHGPSTAVNTNLEQISDWLTKIIVGVSLVNSEKLGAAMMAVARHMAASFGGGAARVSLATAMLAYFSVVGLLGGYLLTRLFLQRAFDAAGYGETE